MKLSNKSKSNADFYSKRKSKFGIFMQLFTNSIKHYQVTSKTSCLLLFLVVFKLLWITLKLPLKESEPDFNTAVLTKQNITNFKVECTDWADFTNRHCVCKTIYISFIILHLKK